MLRLHTIEESPWGEGGRADLRNPLSRHKLAELLREFDVRPGGLRLPDGTTPRGYSIEPLRKAWDRFLPPREPEFKERREGSPEAPEPAYPPEEPQHCNIPHGDCDLSQSESATTEALLHSEDGRDPAPRKGSCGVAVETGGKGNPDGAGPSKEAVEECPPYLHEHPDLLAWWRRLMASGDIRLGDDGGFKGTGKKAAELHRAIEERRAAAALAGATVSDNGARP